MAKDSTMWKTFRPKAHFDENELVSSWIKNGFEYMGKLIELQILSLQEMVVNISSSFW